jgi:hypothetical protein
VTIPRFIQPNLILSVETQQLGIPAGLQDRVIQVHEGLVYMDFNRELMATAGIWTLRGIGSPAPAANVCRLPHRSRRGHRGLPQRHPRPVQSGRPCRHRGDEILGRLDRTSEGLSPAQGHLENPRVARPELRQTPRDLQHLRRQPAHGRDRPIDRCQRQVHRLRRRHRRHLPGRSRFRALKTRLGALGVEVIKPIIIPA